MQHMQTKLSQSHIKKSNVQKCNAKDPNIELQAIWRSWTARQGGPKQQTAGDSLNKRCWFRKSTSLSANHCISRADKTYMACSVTGKSEARWKHETSMWSKLTYIDRNVCWFESQEIPPFNFKTSGNLMIRSKILMIKGQPGQPEAENWLGESSTGRTYTFRIRQLFW